MSPEAREVCSPFAGGLRQAVDGEEGRDLQVWRGGGAHARHALQQLAEDAAGRPHVDGAGVAPSRHHHLPHTTPERIRWEQGATSAGNMWLLPEKSLK